MRRMAESTSEGFVGNGRGTDDRMSVMQICDQIVRFKESSELWKWIEILRDRAIELEKQCCKSQTLGEVGVENFPEEVPVQTVEVDTKTSPINIDLPVGEPLVVSHKQEASPGNVEFHTYAQKVNEQIRPTWDQYFLKIVNAIGLRATCNRGRSGCVIVKDNQILAAGYVGSPRGFDHCDDVGHQMKIVTHEDGNSSEHCVRTIHAEMNAICQAAKKGVSLDGATCYSTMIPCRTCAMHLMQCGIVRVVSKNQYQLGGESLEIFQKAGVKVVCVNSDRLVY